jgi:hypothetical protein
MKNSDLIECFLKTELNNKDDLVDDIKEFEDILKDILSEDEIAQLYIKSIDSDKGSILAKEFVEFYTMYKSDTKSYQIDDEDEEYDYEDEEKDTTW